MIQFKQFIVEARMGQKELSPSKPYLKQILNLIRQKKPILFSDGKQSVVEYNEDIKMLELSIGNPESVLKTGSKYTPIFKTKDGVYKWTDIEKSPFTGKTAGSGTAKEDAALADLNNQLAEIRFREGIVTVPIKIGRKVYQVLRAESTPGTPKSDFHLLDAKEREIVWISHKDGSQAKDFGQWGGVSQRNEPKIAKHPEVKEFGIALKALVGDTMPRGKTLAREIKDNTLKMMAVYGNNFGGALGRQNVTMLIQGPIKLEKRGSSYEILSNHVEVNGDRMTGDYDPIIIARYSSDRSNEGVKGARVSVYPRGGRKISEWI